MDRRNGGDILAPPRPPKHLPRIHRPRAPEPETLLSVTQMQQQQQQREQQQQLQQQREQAQQQMSTTATASVAATATETSTATATATAAPAATTTTSAQTAATTSTDLTQCTNSNNQQQLQQHFNSNIYPSQYSITTGIDRSSISGGVGGGGGSSATSSQSDNTNTIVNATRTLMQPERYEDYEIHHLTILPQRPTTLNLSRNNSHVSTTSSSTSSSSITVANTFTRRRQLPPTPGAAARLLVNNNTSSNNSIGNINNNNSISNANANANANNNARNQANNNNNNSVVGGISSSITGLLSHFHSNDTANAAPSSVTLAQPRPESQRLTNEYVDTPFRNQTNANTTNQLQLQHASRTQHPAGQLDGGQTTTHHLLLLPQREFRQQQQQQQHHRLASATATTMAGTISGISTLSSGSVISTAPASAGPGIDGTDGFIHSQHKTSAATICPHTGKLIPIAPNGGSVAAAAPLGSFHSSTTQQSFTPPAITKQPASTTNSTSQMSPHLVDSNNCKFAKDLPAFDDLLTMHNIATGISTPQGMISAVHGASPLGTPIIIGGSAIVSGGIGGSGGDTSSLNQIICPRCGHCRCEQCQSPPHLPQTWLCNKTCLCSAESVIDYVSCLCCAKALFYHCARDNDMDCDDGSGTPCVDNPCSCGPYKRTQRWGWLGALSLVLPCLWLYWPMRCCVSFCEKCYGRFVGRGCRCHQQTDSPSNIIPISQLGSIGSGNGSSGGGGMASILGGNNGGGSGGGGGGMETLKSIDHHHHHHYQHHNSKNNHHHHNHHHHHHMRKGDVTPKKRLLDSNAEY